MSPLEIDRMRTSPALLILALVLAACGVGATPSSASSGDPVLVIVEGEPGSAGISVAEAIGHGPTDDIVAVTGALFAAPDGTVMICDAIAESFPPQCGGERIRVDGLDLASVPGLQTEGEVSWAERVTLLGSVE